MPEPGTLGGRLQVTLPASSGIARDNVVNTFHFAAAPPPESAATGMSAFYNILSPNTGTSVGHFIGPSISRTAPAIIKAYNMSDPEPGRMPIWESEFTLAAAPDADALPLEVALVLSMRAGTALGDLDRRRRGRVFIGPLGQRAVDAAVNGMPVVEPQLINTLLDAGSALYDASDGQLGVYSRVDDVIRPITELSVNNEFDTQRRRERPATSRTIVTLPLVP